MWRSLVAHLFWEQRVAGSNPVIPTHIGRSDHEVRAALPHSQRPRGMARRSRRLPPSTSAPAAQASKSMIWRTTVPSARASKAEFRSVSPIVSEMSSSTGSFPARHRSA
jgi:hypothetical protein